MNQGQRRGTHLGRKRDSGQTVILVILALGIFLLAAVGFGVDFANFWFHRQAAQGAADAACTAGAMDLLVDATNGVTNRGGFVPGTPFGCNGSAAAPCRYAALNGYDSDGASAGNDVYVSFPGSIPGVTPPPASVLNNTPPFMRVDVVDHVRTFFSGMLTGRKTQDVRAFAECGLALEKAPVPIIVLNPTCPHAFEVSGSASVTVAGGPSRSIQVNSADTCGAATRNSGCPTQSSAGGCPPPTNSTINLCYGGKDFSGSSVGVSGGPQSAASGFNTQNAGNWQIASPISDPFALTPNPDSATPGPQIPADLIGSCTGIPCHLNPGDAVHGCPDPAGCVLYTPGHYDQPIIIKDETAIFDPGIYYIQPTSYPNQAMQNCASPSICTSGNPGGNCKYDLVLLSNSVVRPSLLTTDGNGTMFYLSGAGGSEGYGSVYISSNSGSRTGVAPFATAPIWQNCGASAPPSEVGLPATVKGNVLMGQCTSGGTYLGSPSTDVAGPVRGLLFFEDHANDSLKGQPSMQGGGGLVLAGNLYFHATDYQAFFQLQGNPSSGTFVLGNITADELVLSGNGSINMALNPDAVYYILKATLYR